MSRVVRLSPRRPVVAVTMLLPLSLALQVAGPASAQELPPCTDDQAVDCRLPGWSVGDTDPGSLFGPIEGVLWFTDEAGDAPAGGLDILAVGLGRTDITEPGLVREADGLLTKGNRHNAVREGPGVIVRVVLDRPPDQIDGGHSSIHVVTDADGSRSNNAPGGVAAAASPFAGLEDVSSLTYASTTGRTRLFTSDLADGWYKDKGPWAAAWAAPEILDVLLRPESFGEGFRVVAHVSGPDGGFDSVSLGPAVIPADGEVGWVPSCVEGAITVSPYTITRLTENGQNLRDVEAPASWRGGARFPIDESARAAMEARAAEAGADGDGTLALPARVSLFEDGVVIGQRPVLEVALDGDEAELALTLGLTRRGYNVLRDIDIDTTGDDSLDAWLGRSIDALTETMPPFRSTNRSGVVAGEAAGSCLLALGTPEPPAGPLEEGPEATPAETG